MNDDYWSSPDAARQMAYIGKEAGLQEGYQKGLNAGFQRGRQQGYQEGASAMQAQMEEKIAQLQAEKDALQEFANGAVVALGAAVDVLVAADDRTQKVHFARSYAQRVDAGIKKNQLRFAPHADARFTARMEYTAKLIREALAMCLREDDYPSP